MHAVRRRRYRTRGADSVSRFPLLVSPLPRRVRLASRLARAPFDRCVVAGSSQRWDVVRTCSSLVGLEAGLPPPADRKLTSRFLSLLAPLHLPCSARNALRLRPTQQSSATSVRAAESSARTRTTVSRRPSSVRSTLPSATATSVAWSRRSSTTLAGESLLSCWRARRARRSRTGAAPRGTVTRSEQSGFR